MMAQLFPRLSLTLLSLWTLLTGYIFMISLLKEANPANHMEEMYRRVHCSKLKNKIAAMKTSKQIDLTSFTRDLTELYTCPIKSNITLRELYRVQLHFCCNASGILFLTKHNTVKNQTIPYETNSKVTYRLIPDVYNRLPQDMPWRGHPLRRCAVVGSGGIMINSSCGEEIDSADFIIRFNLAPVNSSDVGLRCDLMNINPSQILRDFRDFTKNSGPLKTKLNTYGNASFMISAFAFTFCTKMSVNLQQVLWPQQNLLFLTSDYLYTLHRFWRTRGLRAPRLSTGFMLISTALELCEDVHVYGFWPFSSDLKQQPVSYHYYDKVKANTHVHAMPEEFLRLLQLHSQGALTLHLQPCS